MGKIKLIAGLCAFAFVLSTVWHIASSELNNYLLKDDLKDVAAMSGARIGMAAPQSDADLRVAVIHRAAQHNMRLSPNQILVRRSGTDEHPAIFLAVKYQARVWMPGFALVFHYKATSNS